MDKTNLFHAGVGERFGGSEAEMLPQRKATIWTNLFTPKNPKRMAIARRPEIKCRSPEPVKRYHGRLPCG